MATLVPYGVAALLVSPTLSSLFFEPWAIFRDAYFATVLVSLSPPPIITRTCEKQYLSYVPPSKSLPLPLLADPGSIDFTVVILTYNETVRLPFMPASTLSHLTANPARTYEILILGDGSSGGTTKKALALRRCLSLRLSITMSMNAYRVASATSTVPQVLTLAEKNIAGCGSDHYSGSDC
ncbi:glycosyltransferase family 2 protein [Athelia psychrophila]|uniref:Glycosyltransferase family 2 protein n=1 Tax=Athelia psychrophila TaxID=1759441 RepID=A0A166G966_9AGAM|nr:glycosyltransferase family 2 protein [Fibularhizoctonia sp. CBS 109695]